MNEKLFNKWYLQLLKGVLFILAGFIIVRFGAYKYLKDAFFIGVFFSIIGIIDILTSFTHKYLNFSWQWLLAEGLQYLFFGVILAAKRDLTAKNLELIIGEIAIFTGIIHFTASVNYKSAGVLGWVALTINAMICVIFGILLIFSDQLSAYFENNFFLLFSGYIIAEGFFVVINIFIPHHIAYDYSE